MAGETPPILFFRDVTWILPRCIVPPTGPGFLWRKPGERAPGLCPGPGGGWSKWAWSVCRISWPVALRPKRVRACPPAGHASAQNFAKRSRAPAGGAPWPACETKTGFAQPEKGVQGKEPLSPGILSPISHGRNGAPPEALELTQQKEPRLLREQTWLFCYFLKGFSFSRSHCRWKRSLRQRIFSSPSSGP